MVYSYEKFIHAQKLFVKVTNVLQDRRTSERYLKAVKKRTKLLTNKAEQNSGWSRVHLSLEMELSSLAVAGKL